jgi:tape measure domain-containing protein
LSENGGNDIVFNMILDDKQFYTTLKKNLEDAINADKEYNKGVEGAFSRRTKAQMAANEVMKQASDKSMKDTAKSRQAVTMKEAETLLQHTNRMLEKWTALEKAGSADRIMTAKKTSAALLKSNETAGKALVESTKRTTAHVQRSLANRNKIIVDMTSKSAKDAERIEIKAAKNADKRELARRKAVNNQATAPPLGSDKSTLEALKKDTLGLITTFSAKAEGARRRYNKQAAKNVSVDVLHETMTEMRNATAQVDAFRQNLNAIEAQLAGIHSTAVQNPSGKALDKDMSDKERILARQKKVNAELKEAQDKYNTYIRKDGASENDITQQGLRVKKLTEEQKSIKSLLSNVDAAGALLNIRPVDGQEALLKRKEALTARLQKLIQQETALKEQAEMVKGIRGDSATSYDAQLRLVRSQIDSMNKAVAATNDNLVLKGPVNTPAAPIDKVVDAASKKVVKTNVANNEADTPLEAKVTKPILDAFKSLYEKYPAIASNTYKPRKAEGNKTPGLNEDNAKYNDAMEKQKLAYAAILKDIVGDIATSEATQKKVQAALEEYAKTIYRATHSKKISPTGKTDLVNNASNVVADALQGIVRASMASGERIKVIADANYAQYKKGTSKERRSTGTAEAAANTAKDHAAYSVKENEKRVNIYDGKSTLTTRGLDVMKSIYGQGYDKYDPDKKGTQGIGSAESIKQEIALVERELAHLAKVLKIDPEIGKKTAYRRQDNGSIREELVPTTKIKTRQESYTRDGVTKQRTVSVRPKFNSEIAEEGAISRNVLINKYRKPGSSKKYTGIVGGLFKEGQHEALNKEYANNYFSKSIGSPIHDNVSGRDFDSAAKLLQHRIATLKGLQTQLTQIANSVNNAQDPKTYARNTKWAPLKAQPKPKFSLDGQVGKHFYDTQGGDNLFTGSPLFRGDPIEGFGSSDLRYGSDQYRATNYQTRQTPNETRAERAQRLRRSKYKREHDNDYKYVSGSKDGKSILGENVFSNAKREKYRQTGGAVSTAVNARLAFSDAQGVFSGKYDKEGRPQFNVGKEFRAYHTRAGGTPISGYGYKPGEFDNNLKEEAMNAQYKKEAADRFKARVASIKAAKKEAELRKFQEDAFAKADQDAGTTRSAGRPPGSKNKTKPDTMPNPHTQDKFASIGKDYSGDMKAVIDAFGKVAATMEQLMKNTFAEINDMLRSTYKVEGRRSYERPAAKEKSNEEIDRANAKAWDKQANKYISVASKLATSDDDKDIIGKDAELIRQGKRTVGGRTGDEAIQSVETAKFLKMLNDSGKPPRTPRGGRTASDDAEEPPRRVRTQHSMMSSAEEYLQSGIRRTSNVGEYKKWYNDNVEKHMTGEDTDIGMKEAMAKLQQEYISNYETLKIIHDRDSTAAQRLVLAREKAATAYENLARSLTKNPTDLPKIMANTDTFRAGGKVDGQNVDQAYASLQAQQARTASEKVYAGRAVAPGAVKEDAETSRLEKFKLKHAGIDFTAWEKATTYTQKLSAAADLAKQKLTSMFNASSNGAKKASHETGLYFKSVTRIASGIAISQMFYNATNAIQMGIGSVAAYSSELEQTRVAYDKLLGSGEKTEFMLMRLQDIAAKTPYTFQSATQSVRQLMAYGFSAEQSLPITEILGDVSVLLGGSEEKMQRIVYAIGQIRAYGKLQAQDLRQLTEAGVPAVDLISKKLGMSTVEFQKAMKKGEISAAEALPALFSALEENFKGSAQSMSETLMGKVSNIADIGKFLGSAMTKGLYDAVNTKLGEIVTSMTKLWQIYRQWGAGGVFEAIVPKQYRDSIKTSIAYLAVLGDGMNKIFIASGVLKYFMFGFAQGFSLAIKIIGAAVQVIGTKLKQLTADNPALNNIISQLGNIAGLLAALALTKGIGTLFKHLFRLSGVLGIVQKGFGLLLMIFGALRGRAAVVGASMGGVGKVMTVLAKHPMLLRFLGFGGILIAVIINLKNLGQMLKNVGAQFSNSPIGAVAIAIGQAFIDMYNLIGGVLTDLSNWINKMFNIDLTSIFKPIENTQNDAYTEWLKSLGLDLSNVTGELEDTADGADKAKDALDKLFTASFDELFQIPDEEAKDDEAGSGTGDGDGGAGDTTKPEDKKPDAPKNADDAKGLGPFSIPIVFKWPEWKPPTIPPIIAPIVFGALAIMTALDAILRGLKARIGQGVRIPVYVPDATPSISLNLNPAADAIRVWTEAVNALRTSLGMAPLPDASISAEVNLRPEPVDIKSKWEELITWYQGAFANPFPAMVMDKTGVEASATSTATTWGTALTGVSTSAATSAASVSANWNTAMTHVGNVSAYVSTSIQTGLASVQTAAVTAANNIRTNFNTAMSNAKTYVSEGVIAMMGWFNGLPTAFATMKQNLLINVGNLKTDILKAFEGFLPTFGIGIRFPKMDDILNNLVAAGAILVAGMAAFFSVERTIKPYGFASGGIITKDQLIRAGEGGRSEAIIPLNNGNAMDPFADAIAARIGGGGGGSDMPTMYVGTLIADERGLKELERKMRVIRAQEDGRRGL